MCGISGSVRNGSCLEEHVSIRMRDSLVHRGPDDAGLWSSPANGVTLGSRRLAILDLSPRGHMPMQDTSGDLTITFNGEIYNCVELRQELETRYPFRSKTDTEVLLAAYSVWGPDCTRFLNGMFAFAIWDNRQKRLFAARDRFGEKPFYYYHNSTVFLFASEIKAILASGMLRSEPNLSSIYRFLVYRETDATEETFFRNILSLRPAHALLYTPGEDTLKLWQYWDIDPVAETRYDSDRAYAEHLLNLLQQSVRIRMRSDVPVGSCLSGGIDSSSIVGLVAHQGPGNGQNTFSARFNDPRIDEGQYIQPIAAQFGATNYGVYPDANRMLEDVNALAWHQEHPFVGPSIYAQWCVMRLAQEHGVTVLLDGQGADENLGGYLVSQGFHCRDLLLSLRWIALLQSLNGQLRRGGLESLPAMLVPQVPTSFGALSLFQLEVAALPPDFRKHATVPPTQAPAKFKSALHNELYQQLRCSMLPKLLRFADRNSMAFSREVRLPFLDHRVVQYLFAIPENQKIRGAVTKFVLRNAMSGKVPEKILKRTDKKGFEAPQSTWLAGPLRTWANDIFTSHEFRERGWVDQKMALSVWRSFLTNPSANQTLLFRWLSLEVWAREFLRPSVAFESVVNQKQARASVSAFSAA
jgi:asparagine synthase (glutamine-hydrolysing)